MAFNQGISNNTTPCEKLRKDHGPFTIPAPQGETPETKPFGIPRTRSSKFDYERVQVRIAAIQAGMSVDEEEEGRVTIPEYIFRSPKRTKIKRMSDVLDYYWIRTFQTRVLRTKDRPDGFRPEMWKSANVIQSRIRRERKVDCRAKSKKAKASAAEKGRKEAAPESSNGNQKPGEQLGGPQPAATEGGKNDSPNSSWVEAQGTALIDEFLDFTSLQENSEGKLIIIEDDESEEKKGKERENERETEKEKEKVTEKESEVERERKQRKEEEKRRAALERARLETERCRRTNALTLSIQLWRERVNQKKAATSTFDYMYLSDGN